MSTGAVTEKETTKEDTTEPKTGVKEHLWCWTRVLSIGNSEEQQKLSNNSPVVGPTYKVNITVHGVKTRALLDRGSQVTIVRQELLPMIRDKQGWSMDVCLNKLIPLKV